MVTPKLTVAVAVVVMVWRIEYAVVLMVVMVVVVVVVVGVVTIVVGRARVLLVPCHKFSPTFGTVAFFRDTSGCCMARAARHHPAHPASSVCLGVAQVLKRRRSQVSQAFFPHGIATQESPTLGVPIGECEQMEVSKYLRPKPAWSLSNRSCRRAQRTAAVVNPGKVRQLRLRIQLKRRIEEAT